VERIGRQRGMKERDNEESRQLLRTVDIEARERAALRKLKPQRAGLFVHVFSRIEKMCAAQNAVRVWGKARGVDHCPC
jgi:hypothetical protein